MDPYNSSDSFKPALVQSEGAPARRHVSRHSPDVETRTRRALRLLVAVFLVYASVGALMGDLYIPLRSGGFHLLGWSAWIMWCAYAAVFGAAWWPRENALSTIAPVVLLGMWLVFAIAAVTTADALSPPPPPVSTPTSTSTGPVSDEAKRRGDEGMKRADEIIERVRRRRAAERQRSTSR